jgi:cell division protein FtsB
MNSQNLFEAMLWQSRHKPENGVKSWRKLNGLLVAILMLLGFAAILTNAHGQGVSYLEEKSAP